MSYFHSDYDSFLDGGSKVPFNIKDGVYFPTPLNIIETLEFDNKLYYKAHSGYSVGIRLSDFVRSITAQDYKYVKSELALLASSKLLLNKTQLVMDFC